MARRRGEHSSPVKARVLVPSPVPRLITPGARRARYRAVVRYLVIAGFVVWSAHTAFAWGRITWVPAYLVAGYLLAWLSTASVNLSWFTRPPRLDPAGLLHLVRRKPSVAVHELVVAIFEEIRWRLLPTVVLVDRLGLPAGWLVVVALIFTIAHLRGPGAVYWLALLELLLFATLLAGLYLATRDLLLVISLHLMRNLVHVQLRSGGD